MFFLATGSTVDSLYVLCLPLLLIFLDDDCIMNLLDTITSTFAIVKKTTYASQCNGHSSAAAMAQDERCADGELGQLEEEYICGGAPDDDASDSDSGCSPGTTTDFKNLFQWPRVYAEKMINAYNSPYIGDLLHYDIVHHENFSGTGSAGIALHMIHRAFVNEWRHKTTDGCT